MKVLQINFSYDRLSTGLITADVHKGLIEHNIDSYVCYGRGPKNPSPNVYRICNDLYARFNKVLSAITGLIYGHCWISTFMILKKIKIIKPDIVHLQCINGYFVNSYRLLNYLSSHRIKTVLTLHADFPYTATCGVAYDCLKWKTGCGNCKCHRDWFTLPDSTTYSWKEMKRCYDKFDRADLTVVPVSSWLEKRAKQSPMLSRFNFTTVLNGIDTDVFRYRDYDKKRRKELVGEKKMVLFITSYFRAPGKGGDFILKIAEMMPDVCFVVVGIKGDSEGITNILQIGQVFDRKRLAELYSMSDAVMLLSKFETFGLPVAEGLCCGTPIVGFKAGGPESIALSEFCEFVNYGEIDSLRDSLRVTFNKNIDKQLVSTIAVEHYSKSQMIESYISVYNKLLNKKQ